ncbi:RAB proteins geranylgeranyltransferase component A (RAB escort protein) [Phaffia rhodozyma]|uniref:RAB proteins geranylgeranyltransferase component A (RAB escort protein) n=1 Tax=Phaffia rhodozyma TaxID=264483 RepID=A0A0F7SMS6_PHARH|nr:RAB proteins geranylgeranyltransferase component A (RAB escort protein) [Phaffia rhodozyma]
MELDNPSFDVIVVGCGLPESIAAASLAHAGKTVLHVDQNDYYGADHASLTLEELLKWACQRKESQLNDNKNGGVSIYLKNQCRKFSQLEWMFASDNISGTSDPDQLDIPSLLQKVSRSFSLSLYPLLIPSVSPLIEMLVASGVSRYSTFRLLDETSVYVPMEGIAKKVPGGKEDVFKDRSINLVEKRRLMKILMWIMGDFESSPELAGKETEPFPSFLKTVFSLSEEMASSLAYALAHCQSPSDPTLPSLLRVRKYLRSVGKYGNSPFLIGQYGGAGEVAQGFCRLSAVQGTIYVLSHPIESINYPSTISTDPTLTPSTDNMTIKVQIQGFAHPVESSHLIVSQDYLPAPVSDRELNTDTGEKWVRCISILNKFPALLRRPLQANDVKGEQPEGVEHIQQKEGEDERDTALVVFPPGSLGSDVQGSVSALLMGEGTGSCPKGYYVLYLTTLLPPTASSSPSPLPQFLTTLTGPDHPLFQLVYTETIPSGETESPVPGRVHIPRSLVMVKEGSDPVARSEASGGGKSWTEEATRSAEEGERLFWEVFGKKGQLDSTPSNSEDEGKGEKEGQDQKESRGFFWPRAEFSGDDDDDGF